MAEQQPKLVKLWLTDDDRRLVMQWLQHQSRPPQAVRDVLERLNEYDAPEPTDAVRQSVFEDLCLQYQDYSTKEVVRDVVLDGWAPSDWQDHLDYMAEVAAEEEDEEDDDGEDD